MSQHVVIAGGGPVGLWLAAELRLGGVAVTVIEERLARDPRSKALTIHPRTLEILASRGIHERFLAEGMRIPSGHFAGLDSRLDFRALDTPFPFTLALPQARTEELLEQHARAAGARIRRGNCVIGLVENAASVTVQVEGPEGRYALEADYLVGCDGTRSAVRAAAGIDFPGTDATVLGWLGDVALDDPPPPGFSRFGARGALMIVPMSGGIHRVVGITPGDVRADWPGDLTLDELRAKTVAIAGRDFAMRDPVWLSRFGNATRQAAQYRRGRVLLAGDAAHQHFPTGGVGLNVGVQDATNLGWKLAAAVHGWAPDGLLDSYHHERHPVGADLLESSRAQTALMTAFSPEGLALRSLLGKLIATQPAFSRDLAERLSALAVAYPPADPAAHPLTGLRAPDLTFTNTGDSLFALLRPARYVLLDLTGQPDGQPDDVPDGALARLARDHVAAPGLTVHAGPLARPRAVWSEVRAALIRPDGHVAWASSETADEALAADARRALAATRRAVTTVA